MRYARRYGADADSLRRRFHAAAVMHRRHDVMVGMPVMAILLIRKDNAAMMAHMFCASHTDEIAGSSRLYEFDAQDADKMP